MAKYLDKKKPYLTVHGSGIGRFEQDGVLFDGAGCEVGATPVAQAAEDSSVQIGSGEVDTDPEAEVERLKKELAEKQAELDKLSAAKDPEPEKPKPSGRGRGKKAAETKAEDKQAETGEATSEVDDQLAAQAELDGAAK